MSRQITILGGVRDDRTGRFYVPKNIEKKTEDFDSMASSTFSSRRRTGKLGFVEVPLKSNEDGGAPLLSQMGASGLGRRYKRPKTAPTNIPAMEHDEEEEAAAALEQEQEQEQLMSAMPEMNNYAKMAAEREERERAQRRAAVGGRLKSFGEGLDQVYRSMAGVGTWMDRVLKIKLVRGKNLPICDARKSDPYVRFTVAGHSKISTVQRSNLNPVWHENFTFKIKGGGPERNVLDIDLYDQDLLPAEFNEDGDDYIGGVKVVLEEELQMDVPMRRWFALVGGDLKEIRGKKQIQQGEVELELLYTIAAGHLQSNLGSLKQSNRRLEAPSPAARLSSASSTRTPGGVASVFASVTTSPVALAPHQQSNDLSRMNDDSKRMVLVGHVGRLRHSSPDVRRMAVQALAKCAGKNGSNLPKMGDWASQVVKSLTERIMKDNNAEVRLDALEALVMTSVRGEQGAIKATAAALHDVNRDVRHAAVTAMRHIANSGDETAIFSVAERLEDSDYKVRESAGEVLSQLSTVHDQRLVKQVLLRLHSIHSVVRKNAVRTLVTVSTCGATEVIDGLKMALSDTNVLVRITAMKSLVLQVPRGDEKMVSLVMGQLEDPVADVRAAAAECLSHISLKGDKKIVQALTGLLSDNGKDLYGHLTVRNAALKAMAIIAQDGGGAPTSPRTKNLAMKGAVGSLGESDWWVRHAAADALAAVSKIGGRIETIGEEQNEVIERLVMMLHDSVPKVRQKACKTLEALAKPGDAWFNATLTVKLVSVVSDERSIVATLLQSHLVATLKHQGLRVSSTRNTSPMGLSRTPSGHNAGIAEHQRCINQFEAYAKAARKGFSGSKNQPRLGKYFLEATGSSPMASPLMSGVSSTEGGMVPLTWGEKISSPMSPLSAKASPKSSPVSRGRFAMIEASDSFMGSPMSPKTPMPRGSLMSRAASMRSLSPDDNNAPDDAGDMPKWMWVMRFLRKIKHGRVCTPEKALEVLENTVDRGEERALEGLLWSLNNPDEAVRRTTIEAIQRIATVGQPSVVAELEKRLKHPRWEFRRDAALALSLVANKEDQKVIRSVLALLDDESREVRASVEEAAKNLFFPGDDRIVIAGSCVQLEQKYHPKHERQEALERLGNLAYRSTHIKLMGYSVDNSDMETFWKRLRMPKEKAGDTQELLPKIMKLFADEDAWVRRAAVRASVECSKVADKAHSTALLKLLDDPSFTVRVVSVHALASLNQPGNPFLIEALFKKMDDHSHLVRLAAVQALQSMVPIGDRRTGDKLLEWLRSSWRFRKGRGDDFEVKKVVAAVVIDSMGLSQKSAECSHFCEGLLHKSVHAQRNAVARFVDHLVQHGLLEPQQLTRHFDMQASVKSYGPAHRLAAIRIQRWLRGRSLIRTLTRFRSQQKRSRDKYRKPASSRPDTARAKAQRKKGLLWFMAEEDNLAEKIVKNKVPEQIRNNAISTAHEKALGGLDDIDLWERMRWTERLRLCEEIAGHPWI